jgi:hypothetical protein
MPPIQCPTCQAALPRKEVESGWCESCGKKLPASITAGRPAASPWHSDPRPAKGADSRSRLMRFIDALPLWWVFIIGCGGVIWGSSEYRVARGTSAEAVDVDLAALEEGGEPPQNHIRIGPHMRVYPGAIYSCDEKDKDSADPPIHFVIYPLLSSSNPSMKKFLQDIEADTDLKQMEKMLLPPIDDVRVLVLTRKYAKLSEVPTRIARPDSITGLIVNPIRRLEKKETDVLRQTYPDIDFSKTFILEEDRKPKSLVVAILTASGGYVLLSLAAVGFFRRLFVRTAP